MAPLRSACFALVVALGGCGGSDDSVAPAPDSGAPGKADAGDAGGAIADAGTDATVTPSASSDASAPIADSGPPALTEDGAAPGDLVIETGSSLQTMDGFGAADVFFGTALTAAQADLFFDVDKGIGLSFLRVGIDVDGSPLGPVADAQLAVARGASIWAAPWSPPGAAKTNGMVNDGGALLPGSYDSWATTIAGFAATMKSAGVPLTAVSVQNEPDFVAMTYASCTYTSAEMVAFVKVLGPKLHALSPPVKLIAPESSVWSDLWTGSDPYGPAILADKTASASVDVLATHQYANGAVTTVPSGVTFSQHLWETEASGVMGSTEVGPSADIADGLVVARWIHDALTVGGANAWHYWWLISLNDDNEGLLAKGGGITKRLYTMGNFSKFVRPGDERVQLTGPVPSGVQISAFSNPTTGRVAIVAINASAAAVSLPVYIDTRLVPGTVTPWVTSSAVDLAAQAPLTVSEGRFTGALAAQSVTTFVTGP